MYEKINVDMLNGGNYRIVDLRSDTLSRPTEAMREAIVQAAVGDDVYGEDPTVIELEKKAAQLLGKEDALFVASGTMANLLAIMVHCPNRGSELISGDNAHTHRFEQGGAAQLAGVQTTTLKNNEDGTFNLDELRDKIRKGHDMHEPKTALICVENTHNLCGGKVLPLDWLEKVGSIGAEHNIPVHMDGARVMNAAVYLKVAPKRVVRDVDTVCFCLSKGLGAPIGSVLCGPEAFIAKARHVRKVLGGAWRQAGIVASAGLVALNEMIDRLAIDHEHTYRIAKAIYSMKSNLFKVDLASVETNILVVYVDRSKVDIKGLQKRLQMINKGDSVKIEESDVNAAIEKIQLVIREYDEKFKCKINS